MRAISTTSEKSISEPAEGPATSLELSAELNRLKEKERSEQDQRQQEELARIQDLALHD